MLDALIVGGGPAGLSAALILGRCRRRVLICDNDEPRNAASRWVGGFFTRDKIAPRELRRLGREQLAPYHSVEWRETTVTDIAPQGKSFLATLTDGVTVEARTLLLATGVVDEMPAIEGIERFYGTTVHHCPYCDGWESRDQPIAIYGHGEMGRGLALELTAWSRDLVLCTDGPAELSGHERAHLAHLGIGLREERIARLEGEDDKLERIVFTEGEPLARRVLFFSTGQRQHSSIPARLGCQFNDDGAILCSDHEATNVPGVFVAGDASRHAQLAILAAAEGANAGVAINTALLKQDLATSEREQTR